jgi:hypothetical protein
VKTLKGVFEANNKRVDLFMDEYGPLLIEWLNQNKTHFTNQHKYCDNVRKCMDHLLADVQSNENKETNGAGQ